MDHCADCEFFWIGREGKIARPLTVCCPKTGCKVIPMVDKECRVLDEQFRVAMPDEVWVQRTYDTASFRSVMDAGRWNSERKTERDEEYIKESIVGRHAKEIQRALMNYCLMCTKADEGRACIECDFRKAMAFFMRWDV